MNRQEILDKIRTVILDCFPDMRDMTMEEDTVVYLGFDKESLYRNMVDAKADWLYGLEESNAIFDADKQHELYLEAKKMNTIVKPKKIGRNDPCPCGSGKKFKQCHGKGGANYYEPEG